MPEQANENFERRYYEARRRVAAARELGRIGVVSVLDQETLQGLEQRRRDEIISGLAEGLHGSVSTEYAFGMQEGKLVAEDGEPIEDMLWRALDDANAAASDDEFYGKFLPQRTQHELRELIEQEAMARGERNFNTIVTFSPYSEELHTPATEKKLVISGQKPYWRRGMLRVSHWDGQKLHIITRSIDDSSVALFKDVAMQELGYEFRAQDSTAMLGEQIYMRHEGEAWTQLADAVVATADKHITQKTGQSVHQGVPASRARDTQSYVESQTSIINHLLAQGHELSARHAHYEAWKSEFENVMYKHVALLDERFIAGQRTQISEQVVADAADAAGARADASGKSFDMCGHVLNARGTSAQTSSFESLHRLIGKKVQCPNCKEKVVVPTEKLEKGHLYCSGCHLDVDVCTGKSKQAKPKATRKPPQNKKDKKKSQKNKPTITKWWEIPPPK